MLDDSNVEITITQLMGSLCISVAMRPKDTSYNNQIKRGTKCLAYGNDTGAKCDSQNLLSSVVRYSANIPGTMEY